MEFSRPDYWSGWPFPSPGDLPNPGIEPRSSALQVDSLPAEPQGKPNSKKIKSSFCIDILFFSENKAEIKDCMSPCHKVTPAWIIQ